MHQATQTFVNHVHIHVNSVQPSLQTVPHVYKDICIIIHVLPAVHLGILKIMLIYYVFNVI